MDATGGQRTRLGDILIQDGVINDQQLLEALKVQERTGERLGAVVIQLRLATEEQIAFAIERQTYLREIERNRPTSYPAKSDQPAVRWTWLLAGLLVAVLGMVLLARSSRQAAPLPPVADRGPWTPEHAAAFSAAFKSGGVKAADR